MNRNTQLSDYTAVSRSLLFIGFEHDFNATILRFPYDDASYQFTLENNASKAIHWLENQVAQLEFFQLPRAIICRLEWLDANNFQLSRQLAAHPDLRHVPVIALTDQSPKAVQPESFAKNNVDDCYVVPVDWSKLEARIEFLNQYKPQVLEKQYRLQQEVFQQGIPIQKRIFDIVGATIGILLSAVIWIPVMVAIRLESKGPAVYRSKRIGYGYKVIDFLKFRSMYVDADQRLKQVMHLNLYGLNGGNDSIFVKIPSDPRTTRVGRFIRKYSIDELPQLINVLKGDMSLVGNRPLPLYEAETLMTDARAARFLAPAGITGLWQISKRDAPNMSSQDRIQLDIQYSNTQYSVMNDLRISCRTLFGAFIQKDDV